jgi:hypothetical protein
MRVNGIIVGRELRHSLRREPIEKLRRRARKGSARARAADPRDEDFEEAIGRTGPLAAMSGQTAVARSPEGRVTSFTASSPRVAPTARREAPDGNRNSSP